MNPPATTGRPTLSRTAGYWISAAVIGISLFSSCAPTALYDSYREAWGFSPFVLTAVFAAYGLSVLVALVAVGRISDTVGRRPTMLASLALLLVALALFVVADGVGWLFAARALQGLSTGAAIGAAGAAMLDLHPRGDMIRAGRLNGATSTGSMGIGILVAAVLVEHGPWPLRLPFVVIIALVALVMAGVALMPEPVERRERLRLRPAWPHVPREIRGAFAFSSMGVFASWSIGSLFLSLGPRLTAIELDTTDKVLASLGVVAVCLAGTLTQLLTGRLDPWRLMAGGSVVLAVGVAATIGSLSLGSGVIFVAAAAVIGIGWGATYLGSLGALTTVIPVAHRAAVMSAMFVVAYLSMSLPALVAGVIATVWDVIPAFRLLGAVVIVVALAVAVIAPRMRPPRAVPVEDVTLAVEPVLSP
ncbi:MAG: MFS transporter [Patulibacter sp.]|nr:MFS transporter [Patulibacter sp.]